MRSWYAAARLALSAAGGLSAGPVPAGATDTASLFAPAPRRRLRALPTPARTRPQDELQRRYRMMEADRKLYADEVQNVVRKQKAQIEKLKRENAQLKNELQLQSRASSMGDGSSSAVKVTRMQDTTDSITRSIEMEKKKSDELDMRTRAVREGILAERRDMGGNNAPQEQNQAIGKQIKVLEHRLHRALVKFNEAIAANKELREEIDNLRRERVVFDGIYKKLQVRKSGWQRRRRGRARAWGCARGRDGVAGARAHSRRQARGRGLGPS